MNRAARRQQAKLARRPAAVRALRAGPEAPPPGDLPRDMLVRGSIFDRRITDHPDFAADPAPYYASLREAAPVHRDPGAPWWLVSSYALVASALHDRRFSSHNRVQRMGARADERTRCVYDTTLSRDPPDHADRRRWLGRALLPRIAALEPRLTDSARALLRTLGRRVPFDFLAKYMAPLWSDAFAALFGIPDDEHALDRPWIEPIAFDGGVHDGAERHTADVFWRWAGPITDVLERRCDWPTGDMASALMADPDAADWPAMERHGEIATMVQMGMAQVSSSSQAAAMLLERRDDWRRFCADPAVRASAVEECLRYRAPEPVRVRRAREWVELGGARIAPGDGVVLMLDAANHDPAAFPDPERFDIARSPNRHLSFGLGPHTCLGAPLARLVTRAALSVFAEAAGEDAWLTESPRWYWEPRIAGLRRLMVEVD